MERANSAVVGFHGLAESQIEFGVPFGVLDAVGAVTARAAASRFGVRRSNRFFRRPDWRSGDRPAWRCFCTRQASASGSAAPERVGQFCKLILMCEFHVNKVLPLLRRTYTDPGLTFQPIYRGRSPTQPKVAVTNRRSPGVTRPLLGFLHRRGLPRARGPSIFVGYSLHFQPRTSYRRDRG